ncbi:MAG TPA: esterase-like activity of phytase family protein [Candidatus Kapabacteria bacterium]|nr:esterase-like activity of phytase family protein [Candidatus Kapabacteria bacterium]
MNLLNRTLHAIAIAGAVAALLLSSCTSTPHAIGPALRASLVAESTIEHGRTFRNTVVGGISGIDRAVDGTWYLISDDRSAKGPARFYTATLDAATARFTLTYVATMKDRDGREFARGTVDPEAIRWDEASGTLWWTSEGDERAMIDPFIREMNLNGSFVREIPLPAPLRMDTATPSGPRDNGVFEPLALSADGRTIIVGLEEGLKQDNGGVTRGATGAVRISFFDRATGKLERQIAYAPEHAPQPASDSLVAGNGVVEILPIDERRLLVLERAYTPGLGNTVRLYAADVAAATDVSSLASLAGTTWTPAPKQLVADFSTLGLTRLDNVEAMAWGPTLEDGRRSLVFMSDNNFNPAQVTQVIVLAVE